jgi:hypothetical protein
VKKVLVVGELTVDLILRATACQDVERLLPGIVLEWLDRT